MSYADELLAADFSPRKFLPSEQAGMHGFPAGGRLPPATATATLGVLPRAFQGTGCEASPRSS